MARPAWISAARGNTKIQKRELRITRRGSMSIVFMFLVAGQAGALIGEAFS
jgi:hypothetical protein